MLKSDRPDRRQSLDQRLLPPKIFAVLLLLFACLLAGYLLINSSLFAIGTVVVQGNKYMSVEDIHRVANIPERLNIFRLDIDEIKRRLTKDLRVAEVTVTRQYPSTIVINIKESQPLAYVAGSYGFFELDKQGMILAVYKNVKQLNVPLITGPKLDGGYVGDKVNDPLIQSVLVYLAALDESAVNQLSEINVQTSGQMTAYTLSSVHIRLGNGDRLPEKAKLTSDILQDVKDAKTIEYIDLTYASPFIRFR